MSIKFKMAGQVVLTAIILAMPSWALANEENLQTISTSNKDSVSENGLVVDLVAAQADQNIIEDNELARENTMLVQQAESFIQESKPIESEAKTQLPESVKEPAGNPLKNAEETALNNLKQVDKQEQVTSNIKTDEHRLPKAESIDLKQVVEIAPVKDLAATTDETVVKINDAAETINNSRIILGVEVPANTSTRLVWTPESVMSGLAEQTPVLVVNGKNPGKTLCLTGAVHGDELNGIEMIRRVVYQLDSEKLTGTVIAVPVVNIMGFRRNSRYLPDRRDLNRYFPGNTNGSSASRIAHSFFHGVIKHCDALVDIHTGSFHRTNLTQLRADLSNESVAELAQSFGSIAVLNGRGNAGSLRAAAVREGIPSVTVEAGEPMRMQSDIVLEGSRAIETLMSKLGMYGKQSKWQRTAPVYYKSVWVRVNLNGILFSKVPLGKKVAKGEVLGTVTDPITNAKSDVVSPYNGRILGMALDQVVLPGFAAYHIGIQTAEAILIEEGLLDDEDGDDVPVDINGELIQEPAVNSGVERSDTRE